jgi:hypothetical protein
MVGAEGYCGGMDICTRKLDGREFKYIAWSGNNIKDIQKLFAGQDYAYDVYVRPVSPSTLVLETWGPQGNLEESRFVLAGDYIVAEEFRPNVLFPAAFDESYYFPGELQEEPFNRFLNFAEPNNKDYGKQESNVKSDIGKKIWGKQRSMSDIDDFLRSEGHMLYPPVEPVKTENKGLWWESNDPDIFEVDDSFESADLGELQEMLDHDQRVFATFGVDRYWDGVEALEVFIKDDKTGETLFSALTGDSFIIVDGKVVEVIYSKDY